MKKAFEYFVNKLVAIFDNRFTKKEYYVGNPNLLDENYSIQQIDTSKSSSVASIKQLAKLSPDETLAHFKSSMMGLANQDVEDLRLVYGFNRIDQQKKNPWYLHLWLCYKNPFNLLLTVLAIVAYFTDDSIKTVSVLSAMVIISSIIRFIQEIKSNKSVEKLKAMVSTTVTVIRQIDLDEEDEQNSQDENQQSTIDHKKHIASKEISVVDLVPGDIITLSAGDMIPADVRILSAKDLFVSQATLTGESLPVEKFSSQVYHDQNANNQQTKNIINHINNNINVKTNVFDTDNICFMGTNVISGTATAIVIATGKSTIFGSLANSIINPNRINNNNNFQKNVNRVSWLLIFFMLVMTPIVFIINGITKNDWFAAALFALSVAVGLTPEMLPMIVTSTLAKGAVFMSRKKVIVKRLDAIQSFGAMDILCTDKTGTLTQDKICLERHTDVFGDEYDDVLEYAYLNSYYQTGLKNLLDVAVLERANFGDIPELLKKYKKVDEVPFDFVRKRMSVVVANNDINNNQHLLICKGAVEEIMNCCTHVSHNDEILPINNQLLAKLKMVTRDLNEDGLRIVAVAIKKYDYLVENSSNIVTNYTYSVNDEKDMILVGYIAFLDPPKETTRQAIAELKTRNVAVKILTGDNELVTLKICGDVGLNVESCYLGPQLDLMNDQEFATAVKQGTVFAKLTPHHKEKIVNTLKSLGHVVGFMGDGINDAPALRAADIGISVDTAVDIAKESADIILLEKNLLVLEDGIEEGRRTFANMVKYIKMTASSNFGNVFSILVASAFLPFEPMLPIHLLIQNLLYDISQTAIPFDNVDRELIEKPQNWNPKDLKRFMIFFGPISSIFDIITYLVLWNLLGANSPQHASLFQTGWFVEGLLSQTLIVHMIRTRKIPFIQSRASIPVIVMTGIIVAIGIAIPMIPVFEHSFKMQSLPPIYFVWLIIILLGYIVTTQLLKNIYSKRFGW